MNGRNALTWEQKFELDVWYVDHQSFWLDLKILWLTVWQVLRGQGIHQPGHATMPEFRGEVGIPTRGMENAELLLARRPNSWKEREF